MPDAKAQEPKDHALAVKETLVSIVISFVMAFVFRGFVVEGFQIPTGSMAPTLLGKHVQVRDPANGYVWTVGPWTYPGGNPRAEPVPEQSGIQVNDPITGAEVVRAAERLRSGDRIFVLKYLRHAHEPRRWDVAVFKNPSTQENYIKRLTGLPGEQVALVDGDVFTRPSGATPLSGLGAWAAGDWTIQRKPERIQRAMLQTVFDSRYTPPNPGPEVRSPWVPDRAADWEGLRDAPSYRHTGAGPAVLAWTDARPIDDWYPYNQTNQFIKPGQAGRMPTFPVSDIALSMGVEPDADGASVSPEITARGRVFRAVLGAGSASVQWRDEHGETWTTLDEADFDGLGAGSVTEVEFWHVDQALWLFVDGTLLAGGPQHGAYELSPAQRIQAATGRALEDLLDDAGYGDPRIEGSRLGDPSIYRAASVRWVLGGGPMTLHRATVKRDIHYQVSPGPRQPTFGGHPEHFPHLGEHQFFACGDNSPSSLDARLWTRREGGPDPWIADQVDDTVGVVHRDLVIGRAFVVYFPAPMRAGNIPIPDAGRIRWIW